jgi:hypothetical protein
MMARLCARMPQVRTRTHSNLELGWIRKGLFQFREIRNQYESKNLFREISYELFREISYELFHEILWNFAKNVAKFRKAKPCSQKIVQKCYFFSFRSIIWVL